MKKRAFWGVAAPLAISALLVPSAFADTLDYAESIGQVETNDTINYVIEATSDGGYVVGGQTVQCYKYEETGAPKGPSDEGGEKVSLSECLENYSTIIKTGNESRGANSKGKTLKFEEMPSSSSSMIDICGFGQSVYRGSDGAYYRVSCLDYLAKFKQNGTKEWLSVIDDSSRPVAVGETSADYRLLTKEGTLYTFAKASGAKDQTSGIESGYVYDAIINEDGTIITVDDENGVALYNADGELEQSYSSSFDGTVYDGYSADRLVRSGDDIVVIHDREESNGNGGYIGTTAIEKISADFSTSTPVLEASYEDLNEEGIDSLNVLSADQNGNILLGVDIYDEENDSYGSYLVVIDKDGELVEMKEVEEVIGDVDVSSTIVLDNFTVISQAGGKLIRLSPNLEATESYDLGEGEMISDITTLKDGSLAGVGFSTASTENYTVDGGMNGTYLRLTAKTTSATGNPNTGDDSKIFVLGGGVILVTMIGFALIAGKRR